jgi:hypothetical protein
MQFSIDIVVITDVLKNDLTKAAPPRRCLNEGSRTPSFENSSAQEGQGLIR